MKTGRIRCVLSGLILFLVITWGMCAQAAPFEVHLLDVGQGLSVLVKADDAYLLYDGGGRGSSSFVVSYLKRQGIDQLDYLVASHYDEDHISGLVGALYVFSCGTILEPDYQADTEIYASYQSAAEASGAEICYPEQGQKFAFGDGGCITVVGPDTYCAEEENNRCVAIRITYSDRSLLLCGDAMEEEESQMAVSGEKITSDYYVVNHHGSARSTTSAFLEQAGPAYALLSCSQGNTYGHPAQEVMEKLQSRGCQLFRTDQQGTVVLYSDGESDWFSQDPCDDYTPGEMQQETNGPSLTETEETEGNGLDYTYVCNTNTKKFHRPECKSVQDMKEKNKLYTSETRDALIAMGYSPCKNCNP